MDIFVGQPFSREYAVKTAEKMLTLGVPESNAESGIYKIHSRFMPKADYGADIFFAVLDKRQNGHHGYSREKSAVRHFCQRLKALYGKKNINITGHKRTF